MSVLGYILGIGAFAFLMYNLFSVLSVYTYIGGIVLSELIIRSLTKINIFALTRLLNLRQEQLNLRSFINNN